MPFCKTVGEIENSLSTDPLSNQRPEGAPLDEIKADQKKTNGEGGGGGAVSNLLRNCKSLFLKEIKCSYKEKAISFSSRHDWLITFPRA